jgi:hypothetical protein
MKGSSSMSKHNERFPTNDQFPTRTIIPAGPGWYVAVLIPGCHNNADESENWDDGLALQPIVAWEIERYQQPDHTRWKRHVSHDVTPLTTEGSRGDYSNPWAIKCPDGKFAVNGVMRDNEADAIQELKDLCDEAADTPPPVKPPAQETA